MSLCKRNKHKTHVAKKINKARVPKTSLSKNKHKARVAKARAAKKNLSKSKSSGGAPGVNARARVHSRAFPRINSNKKISQGLSRLFRTLDR